MVASRGMREMREEVALLRKESGKRDARFPD
jgi:hypothetical protein